VKTVEEYAIDLVVEGAQHVAEDDTNESGEIADEDHQAACDLALDMAKAIRDNPRSFAEWCEGMGVRWNRHEEG
jgi:hypothetical protein